MPASSTIVRIGVDYDGEYELFSITSWMAEWSGASSTSSSRGRGCRRSIHAAAIVFAFFSYSVEQCVNLNYQDFPGKIMVIKVTFTIHCPLKNPCIARIPIIKDLM